MSKNVGWVRRRRRGGAVGPADLHTAPDIGKQVFALQRPMAAHLELHSAAGRPAGQQARGAGALMRASEGVGELLRVIEVGHGYSAGAIHHYPAGRPPHPRTRRQQPVGIHRLLDRERCRSAARIRRRAHRIVLHMHRAEIGLHANHPMSTLEVVACRSTAVEPARAEWLMSDRRNRRYAAESEITGWTEDRTGEGVAAAFYAAGIATDIRALEVLRAGWANHHQRHD